MISTMPFLRRFAPRPKPVEWGAASDTALALAARTQNKAGKEAFVEIVRRHQTAVCAVAYGITGRIAPTEDIAQETFLYAWKHMAALREPAKLKAWLTKIARSTALEALRREQHTDPLGDDVVEIASLDSSPDAAAAAAEDERLVWEALAELPENFRLPLALFYNEGQSIAAVAAALDLSEDAVKQRLSRGREALREKVATRMATHAESKLAGVLRRVQPGPLLVVTIAAAIGLLAAPAALAAGAFSGTATTAPGGSAATASTFSTAMTASSYLVATITMAAFIPLGWQAREPDAPPVAPVPVVHKPVKPVDPFGVFANSALLREWRRLHEVHGTDAAAMPSLYAEIAAVPDAFHRRALRSALLAEWAAVDPEGAFQHLLHEKNQSDHAKQMMREWLALDPAAAAAHLAANVKGAENMAREMLKELAGLAPEQFAAIARQLPPPSYNWDRGMAEAFTVYAAKHPDAARTAAESLSGANRVQALAGVAQGWAEMDGNAALAWARTLTEGPERDGALRGSLIGWAKSDPVAALNNIEAAPPGKEEMHFASDTAAQVLRAASEKNFDTTIAWLAENSGKIGRESWMGLTGAIQKKLAADPAALLGFVVSQPATMRAGLQHALDSVMLNDGYAQRDEVWSWLSAQPAGESVDQLRSMMLRTAAWKDPELAMQWMQTMPDSPAAQRLVETNLSSLINNGGNLERIEGLLAKAPEKLRPGLLATAFTSEGDWRQSDLEPWMQRMNELPAERRPQAAGSLASRMAATDPQQAVQWATSLANEDERRSAIGSLTMRWANADSYEASEWVAGLPAGAERDAAAQSLVQSIGRDDPESAWTWAASIGDNAMRVAMLQNSLMNLRERDPLRARQLVNSGGLNAGERAALLESLEAKGPPAVIQSPSR
jgi:RNA polymerase sigma factor (sigma-70 family)